MSFLSVVLGMLRAPLSILFSGFSGELRTLLCTFIRDLYARSLATANPWDDFLVEFLAAVVGVDLSGVTPAGVGGTSFPAPLKEALLNTVTVSSLVDSPVFKIPTPGPQVDPEPGMRPGIDT